MPGTIKEPPTQPNYRNLHSWFDRFTAEPASLYEVLDRWTLLATELVEEYGKVKCSVEFLDLTNLLIAWCDHDRRTTIDPTPLRRFFSQAHALSYSDSPLLASQNPLLHERKPTPEEFADALRQAAHVLWRLRLAILVAVGELYRDRDRFNDTERAAAEYITENPGGDGKQIAAAIDVTETHFRKLFSRKLRPFGFRNLKGRGYFPPGV